MISLEAEGIWGHIVARAKPVEVPEIARIIGMQILSENSRLWEELKAFNSILSDLASADLLASADDARGGAYRGANYTSSQGVSKGSRDSQDRNNDHDGHANASGGGGWSTLNEASLRKVPSLDLTGRTLGQGPGRSSNNSTSRLGSQHTGRSGSVDSLEFVQSIEGCINVADIHEVAEQIRKALRGERSDLESEISVLQQAMDGETDIISSRSASARTLSSSGSARAAGDTQANAAQSAEAKEKKSKISRFQQKEEDMGGRGGEALLLRGQSSSNSNARGDSDPPRVTGSTGDCADCRLLRDVAPGKIRPGKLSTSAATAAAAAALPSSLRMSRQDYVAHLSKQFAASDTATATGTDASARADEKAEFEQQDQLAGVHGNRAVAMCPRCQELRVSGSSGSGSSSRGGGSVAPAKDADEDVGRIAGQGKAGIAIQGGGKSRARNKLQAARDEKHFLDFDL